MQSFEGYFVEIWGIRAKIESNNSGEIGEKICIFGVNFGLFEAIFWAISGYQLRDRRLLPTKTLKLYPSNYQQFTSKPATIELQRYSATVDFLTVYPTN